MDKTFALADHHPPEGIGKLAVFNTFDERAVYLIFLNKVDWPDREKEEVFRCPRCKSFVFSKSISRSRGWEHICSMPRKEKPSEKEAPNDGTESA